LRIIWPNFLRGIWHIGATSCPITRLSGAAPTLRFAGLKLGEAKFIV
jgi:hypothetical protein